MICPHCAGPLTALHWPDGGLDEQHLECRACPYPYNRWTAVNGRVLNYCYSY